VTKDLLRKKYVELKSPHAFFMAMLRGSRYITMFTIVFPLGSLMAALRNLFEAHYDAERMWRDSKRPVPSRPSLTHPLGGWEDMLSVEVSLACFFTSGFFVFCTGQLEAWVDIFNGSAETAHVGDNTAASNATDVPVSSSKEFAAPGMQWGSCQPVSMDASVWWSYGSEDDSQAQCPPERRVRTDLAHDQTEEFEYYMAPNYNCWEMEDERVPEHQDVCMWQEKDFDALQMGMGFHQMAVRLLVPDPNKSSHASMYAANTNLSAWRWVGFH
jgi:hypothetical protein